MDRRMRRGWRPRATDLAFALLLGGVLPAPPPVAGPVAAAEETVLNLARPPVGPAPASCSGIDTAGNGGLALTQTFRDDFDSFDLGAGVWTPHFDHNDYADWRGRTLTGNNELQIYVDPGYAGAGKAPLGLYPFKAERGILEIRAEPVPAALRPLLQDLPYMSGIITSRKSLLQRYGYFEITAKLPAGQGLWPAFWLLSPGQWPPEIDVLEYLGGRPGGSSCTSIGARAAISPAAAASTSPGRPPAFTGMAFFGSARPSPSTSTASRSPGSPPGLGWIGRCISSPILRSVAPGVGGPMRQRNSRPPTKSTQSPSGNSRSSCSDPRWRRRMKRVLMSEDPRRTDFNPFFRIVFRDPAFLRAADVALLGSCRHGPGTSICTGSNHFSTRARRAGPRRRRTPSTGTSCASSTASDAPAGG